MTDDIAAVRAKAREIIRDRLKTYTAAELRQLALCFFLGEVDTETWTHAALTIAVLDELAIRRFDAEATETFAALFCGEKKP